MLSCEVDNMKIYEILNKIMPQYTLLSLEKQNIKYEGLLIEDPVSKAIIRVRLAKKTEKKKGYFVAVWEKIEGVNNAYSMHDFPDYLIVIIADQNQCGYFKFPKTVLEKRKILKTEKQKGKMAFRVYPPFCENLNETAHKSQSWQSNYYISL